jgi:hypothetical protein
MTAKVSLPRMLSQTANTTPTHGVEGRTVKEALVDLFRQEPGLRNHIVDETGAIRPHVSVFVDGTQADLETEVGQDADIRLLHAVSGGYRVVGDGLTRPV